MTDSKFSGPVDPFDSGQPLGQFRDGFGRDLVAAAAERERVVAAPRRRRSLVVAMATASVAAIAIVLAVSLPSAGHGPVPSLGVSPAEAAVRELTQSLMRGVLVRESEGLQTTSAVERSHTIDWTDLATRQQHLHTVSGSHDLEYWNPSAHERWSVDASLRSSDGRPVVTYSDDNSQVNASSGQSPVEEVRDLESLARAGKLTLHRERDASGASVVVLEQRQKCYALADNSVGECPDPTKPSNWPAGAPKGMAPVLNYETWWLADDGAPRMLRLENGAIDATTGKRTVAYRLRYLRWQVLPATPANLALVRPPAFSSTKYLVLKGSGAVDQALKSGQVVCAGAHCPPLP